MKKQLVFLLWALGLVLSFSGVASAGDEPIVKADSKADAKADTKASNSDRYENLGLFQKVLYFIEQNYVEEVKNKDLDLRRDQGHDGHARSRTQIFCRLKSSRT